MMAKVLLKAATPKKRALAYLRVSTLRQAQHLVSLEEQSNKAIACAVNNNAAIVQSFEERGRTGRLEDRPEFKKMMAFACDPANRIDMVVVYAISRFFRNVRHYLNFKDVLEKAGVELISATQDIPSGPAGRLMGTMIAAFDEHASEVNAETVRDVMANNAEAGFWNGAAAPFGYKIAVACMMGKKEKKSLVIDVVEASDVTLIFNLYLERQNSKPAMGIKQIASYLNQRGR